MTASQNGGPLSGAPYRKGSRTKQPGIWGLCLDYQNLQKSGFLYIGPLVFRHLGAAGLRPPPRCPRRPAFCVTTPARMVARRSNSQDERHLWSFSSAGSTDLVTAAVTTLSHLSIGRPVLRERRRAAQAGEGERELPQVAGERQGALREGRQGTLPGFHPGRSPWPFTLAVPHVETLLVRSPRPFLTGVQLRIPARLRRPFVCASGRVDSSLDSIACRP